MKAPTPFVTVPVAALVEYRVRQTGRAFPCCNPALHPVGQHVDDVGSLCCHVDRLAGVLDQVVQFHRRLEVKVGLQGSYQLPLGRPPAVLSHPGTLGDVHLRLVGGHIAANHAHQAPAIKTDVALDFREFQQCGHKVLELTVAREPQPGRNLRRVADDERDMEVRVVEAVVVEPAFMLVKRLAVVGDQHNDHVIQNTAGFEELQMVWIQESMYAMAPSYWAIT